MPGIIPRVRPKGRATMPKTLDTFEFPHGGRKGLEYDFDSIMDGQIWQLVQGDDFAEDTKAETFLGALSRAANAKNMRVSKHVSDDGKTVTVRVRPKKEKVAETPKTDSNSAAAKTDTPAALKTTPRK